jgi:hypothetical protein
MLKLSSLLPLLKQRIVCSTNKQVSMIHGFQAIYDRSRPKRQVAAIAAFFIITTIAIVVLGGCGGGSGGNNRPSRPAVTSDPSREDIIQAVRRSVQGKTYVVRTAEQEARTHICSQYDVDLDPYMPRNPELAKCPRVGATYTTWEPVSKQETRTCDALPSPEYGWYVEEINNNRWRVSHSGSVWDVEKRDGGSASVGEFVTVSGFSFLIKPHQDC